MLGIQLQGLTWQSSVPPLNCSPGPFSFTNYKVVLFGLYCIESQISLGSLTLSSMLTSIIVTFLSFLSDLKSILSSFLCNISTILHIVFQLVLNNLLKRLYLLNCIAFYLCENSVNHIRMQIFLDFLFSVPLISFVPLC